MGCHSIGEAAAVPFAHLQQEALCCSVSSLFDVGGTGGAGMMQQAGCV